MVREGMRLDSISAQAKEREFQPVVAEAKSAAEGSPKKGGKGTADDDDEGDAKGYK